MLSADNPTTWAHCLTWVEYAHNTLSSASTGLSPFQVVYSYQPPLFEPRMLETMVPCMAELAGTATVHGLFVSASGQLPP